MVDADVRVAQWAGVRIGPRRLCHGNWFVRDLQRSVSFYKDVCGLSLVFEEPGISAAFLSNGNSHHDVALMQVSDEQRIGRDGQVQVTRGRGRTPGLNHLGFEMETEARLVAGYQRALAAGVRIHRTADHQIAHSVYLFDPEGNYLELYADASRDWREIYQEVGDELLTGLWDPFGAEPTADVHYEPEPPIVRVDAAPLHPLRSARAAMVVSDLARAIQYYCDVIGLRVLAGGVGQRVAVCGGALGLPDVSLMQADEKLRPGLHHFGLEVGSVSELTQASARLRHAGVAVVAEIDTPWKQSIVLKDPDGICLEFFASTEQPVPDPSPPDHFDPLCF